LVVVSIAFCRYLASQQLRANAVSDERRAVGSNIRLWSNANKYRVCSDAGAACAFVSGDNLREFKPVARLLRYVVRSTHFSVLLLINWTDEKSFRTILLLIPVR